MLSEFTTKTLLLRWLFFTTVGPTVYILISFFFRYYFIFESWNYFFVLSIAAATSSGSYLLTFVSNPVESFHEFGSQFPRVINFMM